MSEAASKETRVTSHCSGVQSRTHAPALTDQKECVSGPHTKSPICMMMKGSVYLSAMLNVSTEATALNRGALINKTTSLFGDEIKAAKKTWLLELVWRQPPLYCRCYPVVNKWLWLLYKYIVKHITAYQFTGIFTGRCFSWSCNVSKQTSVIMCN